MPFRRISFNYYGIFFVLLSSLCLVGNVECKPRTVLLENFCNDTIKVSSSKILKLNKWKDLPQVANGPCVVGLSAFSPYHSSVLQERVRVSLLSMSIPGQPPVCQFGHVDILNRDGTPVSDDLGLCGHRGYTSWDSKSNTVYVTVTSTNSNECDTKNEFCCSNGRCVDASLTCDGYDDCGDNSDERSGCLLSGPIIAVIVVGSFVLVVLMITIAIVALKRNWTSGWGVGASLTSSLRQESGEQVLSPNMPSIHSYGATDDQGND